MPEPTAEELTTERHQLRAEIREAHEALKDLRAAIKEAKHLMDTLIPETVAKRFEDEVSTQLEALGTATRQAIDDATDRVTRQFDKLMETALDLKAPRRGEPTIPDLFRNANRTTRRTG